MRNIRRAVLPAHARRFLNKWAAALPGELAACSASADQTLAQAQAALLRRKWKDKRQTVAMKQVAETLIGMNGPLGARCMYCEDNQAAHLDHHEPRSRARQRLFDWSNLIWACDICDSTHKGSKYAKPETCELLLSPTDAERVTAHFSFNSLGCARVRTARGAWTVQAIGLDREDLQKARRAKWLAGQTLIHVYAQTRDRGQEEEAAKIEQAIRDGRLVSVLRDLIAAALSNPMAAPKVRAAIQRYPHIREWPNAGSR